MASIGPKACAVAAMCCILAASSLPSANSAFIPSASAQQDGHALHRRQFGPCFPFTCENSTCNPDTKLCDCDEGFLHDFSGLTCKPKPSGELFPPCTGAACEMGNLADVTCCPDGAEGFIDTDGVKKCSAACSGAGDEGEGESETTSSSDEPTTTSEETETETSTSDETSTPEGDLTPEQELAQVIAECFAGIDTPSSTGATPDWIGNCGIYNACMPGSAGNDAGANSGAEANDGAMGNDGAMANEGFDSNDAFMAPEGFDAGDCSALVDCGVFDGVHFDKCRL